MGPDFNISKEVILISNALSVKYGVDLPRVELLSFNGRPTVYRELIGEFWIQVAGNTCVGVQLILYLLHQY